MRMVMVEKTPGQKGADCDYQDPFFHLDLQILIVSGC